MCKLQDSFKSAKCSVVNICVVLNSQLPFPALELILEACAGRAEHMAGLDPLCNNHGTPNDNSDLSHLQLIPNFRDFKDLSNSVILPTG